MSIRNVRITLAIVVLLFVAAVSYHTLATADPRKGNPAPSLLREESLRGSMQGKSAIALDLNGDGNDDLVVGAPYAQHRGASGALLVYLGTSLGFANRPSAVISGEGNLGWSLVSLGDIDGDGKDDFAAGAVNGSGDSASLAGTVVIHKGGKSPRAVAVLEGDTALDRFGYALASGDVNGDGRSDLIVGAPLHSPDPSLYQQGAVYVFFGPRFDRADAVKIAATTANGGLGFTVAAGDTNNDGFDDVLLGASGKVIVYLGGASFSPVTPDIVFTSRDAGFGRAIAVLWDVNGDGFRDVALGAFQAVISGIADCGRLFVLKGGPGPGTVNADVPSDNRLAVIDGELNSGQFAATVVSAKDASSNSILAVSATHADGSHWLMTGKIFLFGPDLTAVKTMSGEGRDMHLGSSLTVAQRRWGALLAAGAPTEMINTGGVRLYDLNAPAR